jgi:hypothetical protein
MLGILRHSGLRASGNDHPFSTSSRAFGKCRVRRDLGTLPRTTAASGTPIAVDRALGYNDVLEALHHYLQHDNNGRGVVLIEHEPGRESLQRS